jgi:predicted RNA-binding protein with PUA-like domain
MTSWLPRNGSPPGAACATTRHATSCATRCASATAVASAAYPDATQFDRSSPYYDPKAKRDQPRWFNVEVRALRKTRLLSLAELRRHKSLARMRLLQPGNRLSITPVSEAEWKTIAKLL